MRNFRKNLSQKSAMTEDDFTSGSWRSDLLVHLRRYQIRTEGELEGAVRVFFFDNFLDIENVEVWLSQGLSSDYMEVIIIDVTVVFKEPSGGVYNWDGIKLIGGFVVTDVEI